MPKEKANLLVNLGRLLSLAGIHYCVTTGRFESQLFYWESKFCREGQYHRNIEVSFKIKCKSGPDRFWGEVQIGYKSIFRTPLFLACTNGLTEHVKLLLEYNANLEVTGIQLGILPEFLSKERWQRLLDLYCQWKRRNSRYSIERQKRKLDRRIKTFNKPTII